MNNNRKYISNPEGTDERKVKGRDFFSKETADQVAEVISVTPRRPLGKVSEYVTGAMKITSMEDPIDENALAEVEQYIHEQVHLLEEQGDAYFAAMSDAHIAVVDLLFLKAFYQVRLKKRNEELRTLAKAFAKHNNRIPQLTYEDLVLTNPLETDPRTFFIGNMGKSELDFYKGHNVIEQYMAPAIEKVWEVMDMCDAGEINEELFAQKGQEFNLEWRNAMRYLGQFHQISGENFVIFRNFFKTDKDIDPDKELRGASGAFSPGVPILDMLIGLNSLDTANEGYLEENIHLYPRDSQKEILSARARFHDNKSMVAYAITHNSPALYALRETIGKSVLRFREAHANLVKTKAPDVYEGKIEGTGGFMVEEFLLKNIETTKKRLGEGKNKQ